MISVYKGSVPKDGVSGPPKESLLLQKLVRIRQKERSIKRIEEQLKKQQKMKQLQRNKE